MTKFNQSVLGLAHRLGSPAHKSAGDLLDGNYATEYKKTVVGMAIADTTAFDIAGNDVAQGVNSMSKLHCLH